MPCLLKIFANISESVSFFFFFVMRDNYLFLLSEFFFFFVNMRGNGKEEEKRRGELVGKYGFKAGRNRRILRLVLRRK